MDQMHAGLLLLLLCSAYSSQFRRGAGYGPFVPDPEREWKRLEKVIAEEMAEALTQENKFLRSASGSGSETPEANKVPEYVVVSSSEDQKEVFKPEKGARPLPDKAREILLRTAAPSVAPVKPRLQLVEMLCHVDRIYVRVRRFIFKSKDSYKHLKLGNCPVNQGTKQHFYLLYLMKTDCGFKKEVGVCFNFFVFIFNALVLFHIDIKPHQCLCVPEHGRLSLCQQWAHLHATWCGCKRNAIFCSPAV